MTQGDGETPHVAAPTTPTVRVAGPVGIVAPFNGKDKKWIDYAERLKHFLPPTI